MQNSVGGSENRQFSELRLLARAVGFLAALTGLLYLRVAIDEGMLATQENGVPMTVVMLLALFLIGTVGLIAALRWEHWGGGTAVLSGIGLILLFVTMGRDWLNAFFFSSPFIIAGLLFVSCSWQARRLRH